MCDDNPTPLDMRVLNPLRLTGREQEFLAQLCCELRGWLYQHLLSEEGRGRAMVPEELDDRLLTLMLRFDQTPQLLDGLYDRLHRTGANA
jgi:hypothetical protein